MARRSIFLATTGFILLVASSQAFASLRDNISGLTLTCAGTLRIAFDRLGAKATVTATVPGRQSGDIGSGTAKLKWTRDSVEFWFPGAQDSLVLTERGTATTTMA